MSADPIASREWQASSLLGQEQNWSGPCNSATDEEANMTATVEPRKPRTIGELKRLIEAKTLTIEEVQRDVAALLDANEDLNAFISVMLEDTSQGETSLPLAGVPIGIKDFFDTAGVRTTAGCARFAS